MIDWLLIDQMIVKYYKKKVAWLGMVWFEYWKWYGVTQLDRENKYFWITNKRSGVLKREYEDV